MDVDKPSDDVGQTGHGQLSAHVLNTAQEAVALKIKNACTTHRAHLQTLAGTLDHAPATAAVQSLADAAVTAVTQRAYEFAIVINDRFAAPNNPLLSVEGYVRQLKQMQHQLCGDQRRTLLRHTTDVQTAFLRLSEQLDDAPTLQSTCETLIEEFQAHLQHLHTAEVTRLKTQEDKFANPGTQKAKSGKGRQKAVTLSVKHLEVATASSSSDNGTDTAGGCLMSKIVGVPCDPPCTGHTLVSLDEAHLSTAMLKFTSSAEFKNQDQNEAAADRLAIVSRRLEEGINTVTHCFRTFCAHLEQREQSSKASTHPGKHKAAAVYVHNLDRSRTIVKNQMLRKFETYAKTLYRQLDAAIGSRKGRAAWKFDNQLGYVADVLHISLQNVVTRQWPKLATTDEAFERRLEVEIANASKLVPGSVSTPVIDQDDGLEALLADLNLNVTDPLALDTSTSHAAGSKRKWGDDDSELAVDEDQPHEVREDSHKTLRNSAGKPIVTHKRHMLR